MLFPARSYRSYPIAPRAGSQPTPQRLSPPGTCRDPPTQHRCPEPRCRARGGARGVPDCPLTPGRCRAAAARGTERGGAASVCIRSGDARPHVTARQPDRARPRAAAGPNAVSSPGRDRADREPRSVLFLLGVPVTSPPRRSRGQLVARSRLRVSPGGLSAAARGCSRLCWDMGTRGRGLGRSLGGSGCPGRAGTVAGSRLTQHGGMSPGRFAGRALGAPSPRGHRSRRGPGGEETGPRRPALRCGGGTRLLPAQLSGCPGLWLPR